MTHLLTFSSKDRISGTPEEFRIKLTNPVEDVESVSYPIVNMKYSFYNIMSGINDKIYITVAGPTTYTATLTEGNYANGTLLATEAQTQINAAYTPDNNFTVTYSASTSKITVAHSATNFQLTFATNTTASARRVIGFTATDTTAGLSTTGDMLINLTHDDTIYIASPQLMERGSIISDKNTAGVLPVSINTAFGGTITQTFPVWNIHYKSARNFKDLEFIVLFEDMTTRVPLNNMDWSVCFRVNKFQ